MDKSFILVAKVYGAGSAEAIRMSLEAAGFEVLVAQESAGKSIYPMTIGKMAQVKIFVRGDQAEQALALIRDVESGKFTEDDDIVLGDEEPDGQP